MFRTRQAKPTDVARNFEIWRTAVEATHHFLDAANLEAIGKMVAEEYLPNAEFTVAVDGQDLPMLSSEQAETMSMRFFVHADSRGMGLGRLLLDGFRAGKDIVTVDVNEQNPEATGFYRRLGFKVTSRSELDDQGRPYPILHLRWESPTI